MHEYVVVVMGPTGVGKSSFIQDSVSPGQRAKVKIGHTLQSETNEVQPFCWNTKDGARVKLVDTPGFDDSRAGVTDQEILARIVTFLIDVRNGLTGLIYVHRITDNRVGGTSQCNLQLFQKLCGDDSMKNVVIVTTMWDKGTTEERLQHEKELMSSNSLFKPLLDGGAVMRRHDRTHKSATNIIEYLTEKSPTTTRIFREHVQEGKALKDTAVGAELHRQIAEREKKPKEEMESLEADTREMLHNTQNVSRHRSLVQPYLVSGQHHGECVIA
ncbi:P-loop containing nucleoside triphosphate hydrolase protein [Scleroderma citrinum]